MIERVNYITQEKNKSEDYLISSVALLKKNVKDYNDLLIFSSQMARDFMELYENLKAAPKDSNKKLPFTDKNVAPYKGIINTEMKNIRRELKSFTGAKKEEELAFPLVSSPNKALNSSKKVEPKQK